MRLDDIFQFDHAEDVVSFGNDKRRRAAACHLLDARPDFGVERPSLHRDPIADRVERTLANLAAATGRAAHPRLRRERNNRELPGLERRRDEVEHTLRQNDNALPLRRLVAERCQQRRLRELVRRNAGDRMKR